MAYGGSPHVHVRISADERSRYLATIRVRVSRPGWLTTCWLSGLAIAGALLAGVLNLSVLFSSAPEASTAATILLALLAVFATVLVSPGAHPLASRLLWAARILIVFDSGVVLWAVGSLLLHSYSSSHHYPTTAEWWVLFALSALCAAMLTIARLLPAGPPRPGGVWNQVKKACARAWDWLKKTRAWGWLKKEGKRAWDWLKKTRAWGWLKKEGKRAWDWLKKTRAWGWLKKKKEKKEPGELDPPDLASLAIPAADGYHYGDDPKHQWDEDKQAELVLALRRAETACRMRAKGRRRRDPRRPPTP